MDTSIVSIERNIVKEIMRECFPRKVRTNENFVHYLVQLLLLDPNWGIADHFVTRDKVGKFVDYVIDDLANPNDPKLVILQMQFYFICNLENIHNIPKKNRKEVLDRLSPLKNDILETADLTFDESVCLLTRKIVSYITLVSGLGNPMEDSVYREATAAFKSVMSDEELKEFIEYSKNKKEKDLVQLTDVVSGIRLFNKDCERGGAGIEELSTLLDAAIKSVRADMETTLSTIMVKVNTLTTVADKCYNLEQKLNNENEYIITCTLSPDIEHDYMENIKDLLVFYRQYELYIRQIIQELANVEKSGQKIDNDFHDMLLKVHEAVYMKIAVPATIIFPLFEALAHIWMRLQDQVIILAKYSEIVGNMAVYSKNTNFSKCLSETFVEETLTDADRLEKTSLLRLTSDNPEVIIYSVESFPDVDHLELQFLGFCCWKLVETDGALIPGNPGMGVANYQDRNYVFSVPEACQEFSRNPTNYIRKVLDMARKKPYLTTFLKLNDQLEAVKDIAVLAEVKSAKKITDSKAIQTGDFEEIVPPNIDPKYFWNIWDLKKEALLLADLSRRKTVSVQTIKTFSTNCMKTQTYGTKIKSQQTMKDNYTNVPKPSNFIYGLRGRKDDEQFIIDLTRPVNE